MCRRSSGWWLPWAGWRFLLPRGKRPRGFRKGRDLGRVPGRCPTGAAGGTPPRKGEAFLSVYVRSGLPLLLAAILLMGLLKDGMMTWVPQMISDTFQVEAYLSIFLSAALPLVNSLSVWLVRRISRGHEGDDMRNGALLFLGAVAGMGVLLLAGGLHPLLSVVLFSIISTFVTGTNVILISFVPLQFTAMGRTSTIAGLTNAFTYLGSALSGWGLAGSPGGTAGAWSTGSWRGSAFWAALFAWRRGRCGGGLPKPETPAGPNRNKKEEMRCYPSAETIILWR